jgi:hypothetical protein
MQIDAYDDTVRTTVTLDPDVVAALRRAARERGSSFKAVLNDAVRQGLTGEPSQAPYRTPSRDMGLRDGFDIDKALTFAGADEDAETLRKLALRK